MLAQLRRNGFRRRPDARRILRRLDRDLAKALRAHVRAMAGARNRTWVDAQATYDQAAALLSLRRQAAELAATRHGDLSLRARLEALQSELLRGLLGGCLPSEEPPYRARVIAAVASLEAAVAALPVPERVVRVPGRLLALACRQLVPPERMAVAAGVESRRGLVMTGLADVTDEETATDLHVRANSEKLGRELRAMDRASARLAGWFHSHPGLGPGATLPSGTDRRQYADWSREYDGLVAAIFTADGYVRFWGDAVEKGERVLRVEGAGVERIDDFLYRLS